MRAFVAGLIAPLALAPSTSPVPAPADPSVGAPTTMTVSTATSPAPRVAAHLAGPVLTVHGRGFGHGHGLSQYGAYGAARRGLDHRRILAFYYPGTRTATGTGRVRVLISADTTDDVRVSPASGLRVRDLGAGTTYRLPQISGVRRWRLTVDHGRSVLGYLTSAWHRYRPGGHDQLAGDGQFRADVPLTLWTPAGPRTYRGALRAASPTPGSALRDTVNVLSLDRYVRGVIAAEMPSSWSAEALAAQAVAARTYATWSRDHAPDRSYQLCDTSACQVYGGVAVETSRTDAAVAATSAQILTSGGTAAFTQFSASDGGWTAAGGQPYLVARPDPYDAVVASSAHAWTTTVAAATLERAYPRLGRLTAVRVTRRDGHGEWGGRALTVGLRGSRGSVSLSGDSMRGLLGLRSTWFTVSGPR